MSGEGLSAAEREALAGPVYEAYRLGKYGASEYIPMWHELAVKPTGTPEDHALFVAVERILADRLAAVQAEQAATWEPIVRTATWRLAIAESARDTALREKADAEARLAEVEALEFSICDCREAFGHLTRCAWRKVRAALANPSAAQREAEVGARALREALVGHRFMARNSSGRMGCRGCTWTSRLTPGTDRAWAAYVDHIADALPTDEAEVPR